MWLHHKGRNINTDWTEINQRRREQQSRMWNEKWVTEWRLIKIQNWTAGAVAKFLGKAKRVDGYKVHAQADVKKAIRSKAFKEWYIGRLRSQHKKNLLEHGQDVADRVFREMLEEKGLPADTEI